MLYNDLSQTYQFVIGCYRPAEKKNFQQEALRALQTDRF